jgi:thermitase
VIATGRRAALRRIAPIAGCRVAAWVVGGAAVVALAGAHAQPTRLDDELLVGFRAGVSAQTRAGLVRHAGGEFIEDFGHEARVVRLHVAPGRAIAVKRELARHQGVAFVENNAVLAPALIPNDPQYASQWHLPQIRAPQAWELTQGAPGAVIAILDSGVDPRHPEFAGKLVMGTNTYDKSGVTADQHGHGTKMAGVAAARGDNGVGIAGVAGQSSLMPVRVTDRKGHATSASIAKGIVWAADHGARVVNLSLEGVAGSAAILAAAQYAVGHGALVVAPAGNCGCVDPSPDTPYLLSVAATDASDRAASFSTAGAFVDLAAPGTNIPTTAMFGLYMGDSGTSVASAVVAGVASLMFAANPALTPQEAARILQETASDPQRKGRDLHVGHGRVDAFAAVRAAAAYRPPAAPESAMGGAGSASNAAAVAVKAP